AIGRLSAKGGLPMLKEAQSSKHVVLDGSLTDMLLELRRCKTSQQELTEKINNHQSAIDILRTNKEEQEKKIRQVNVSNQKGETETQKLSTEPSVYKDKCTEELEACKNDIKKNEEIIKELQDQSDKKQTKIADLILHICKLEAEYEQHDKMLKEHDEHLAMLDGQGSKQGEQIAQQSEQLAQHCEQIAQQSEQITKQGEQITKQGEQMEKQGEQMEKQGRSNQTRLEEDTRALIEEDVREGTFVITKAVTDGLLLLKQNGVLLITGYAGTGKSRIGRHILHMYCTDNISCKCIKLNTLGEWEDMISREHTVVVLLDDIFGETNCIYNREKDTPVLDKVHAYVCKGKIKVIITIRDTVKRQCQEVFDSNRLFKSDFIDLSCKKYLLSKEEKHTILTKYMKTVHKSDYIKSKGFVDCNGDLILKSDEVWNITQQNPVKGFPLVVYQFVHNDKYFKLGRQFFDRPTEAMLEEMDAIRRKGDDHKKFMIQYGVLVYIAINENCIYPDDSSKITEIAKVIDAIYGVTTKMKKCNILDAVKELKRSYLVNIPKQRSYRLHHPTLQESVILSFAQIDKESINKIIPLISWSFFEKMVKSESYKEKEGEVVLRIPTYSLKILANRLVDFFRPTYENDIFSKTMDLCYTEIFQQEYCLLLPWILEGLEKEGCKNNHRENMINSDHSHFNVCLSMKDNEIFLLNCIDSIVGTNEQLDLLNFVLTKIKTNNCRITNIKYKNVLIAFLYVMCSNADVRNVKTLFDIVEENKIPVLLDQGVKLSNARITVLIYRLTEDSERETCVFLTLCIWNAYIQFNTPVLEFLLSKYNQTPFKINLFFKMIYSIKWLKNHVDGFSMYDNCVPEWPSLSFKALKWMIETFKDQKLDKSIFNLILRTACKYQMFDTVDYLASRCKTIDKIYCLRACLDKVDGKYAFRQLPFNQELFDLIIKNIDTNSKELIPIVISVTQKEDVPDYMSDAFLPVCSNNTDILTLACQQGQFYLAKLIIENSNFAHLDIHSALIAACKESEKKPEPSYYYNKDDKVEKVENLKIVIYIVEKFGFEQFDLKVVCQQACSAKRFKIIKWFVQNIDISRLNLYAIIHAVSDKKNSDILEHIMKKIEIDSYYMKKIVNIAYKGKCFELLMWIHANIRPHISIDSWKLLMLACEDDRVDVAKWVLRTFEHDSLYIGGWALFPLTCITINERGHILKDWEDTVNKLIDTLNWILATFRIKSCYIVTGVSQLIGFDRTNHNILSNYIISILEKYLSDLKKEDVKRIFDISLQQKYYILVNWFLQKRDSCSFDKQMILNKACTDAEVETIGILSKYFYALDINQAMINMINRYTSVACLNMLWNGINKTNRDSFDKKKFVSTVCKEKEVNNELLTWILLKLPLDHITINEVLITCCQQGKPWHVKYILHEVDNKKLDIKEAFVHACLAATGEITFLKKYHEPHACLVFNGDHDANSLMIVDDLFQMINDKDSYVSLVVNELLEKKKFDLILYFLQAGYCRHIDMKNLMTESCKYGQIRQVQWILRNVEHKELNIKSAFHEACDGLKHGNIHFFKKNVNHVKCLALMWHYMHDINMFEIDTVLNKMQSETSASYSDDGLKTWLLYIKNINHRINQLDNTLLNTEENLNQQSQQVNDGQCCLEDSQANNDLNSRDEQDDCPSPTKRMCLEIEEQK
ncbi:Hypothetical predicted protein, partial [Mytilus galloprovincialis]